MIDGLKPYLVYKDSGVPWLGKVPEHWEVRKLRQCGTIAGGMTPSMEIRRFWDGRLPWVTPKDMKRASIDDSRVRVTHAAIEETPLRLIAPPAVLLVVRGMILARRVPIAWTTAPVTINQDMKAITPAQGIHSEFLARSLDSAQEAFIPLIDEAGHGTRRLPTERWRDLPMAMPPQEEQSAVARFLDHADRRIRRYIRAKQKLIKLLEEQRQAIIQRAVTRGLDPNVRLKPSGVKWLGDVPEHWEARRNGRLFAQRHQTGFGELPILEVSLRTGVRVREFEGTSRKQIMSDRDMYKRAAKGDIAYNMMRMWQGAVGVVPVDGLVSPAYVVARPLAGIEARYFSNLFRTDAYMREVDSFSRGIVKDRNRLYWEDFKQIHSPCPPPEEQTRIADAIEEITRTASCAMDHAVRGVALLREYRTRLIADVVTGKLDVRAAATRLPEESDEPDAAEDTDAPPGDEEVGGGESGETDTDPDARRDESEP